MLNGATIVDGTLLLIVGNENCLQPQTSEHLAAAEIIHLEMERDLMFYPGHLLLTGRS